MKIFIWTPGQFDNVGDVMHRRVMVKWLRPVADLHLFVGDAPVSFLKGLELSGTEKLYQRPAAWVRAASAASSSHLGFTPGEMNFGNRRLLGETALLAPSTRIRATGGSVFRVGIAPNESYLSSNGRSRTVRALLSLTNELAWRDGRGLELIGRGELIPDLAFAIPGAQGGQQRDRLTVTVRGDIGLPSTEWIEGVRVFADRNGLRLTVVTQVRRDNDVADTLASMLNADAFIWPLNVDHRSQEATVREVYAASAAVISDRLHALIAAATEGAVPIGALRTASRKIQSHFLVVGVDVGRDVRRLDRHELSAYLEEEMSTKDMVLGRVRQAGEELDRWRGAFVQRLVDRVG